MWGTGIDVEDIERFAALDAKRHRRFFERVYTKSELTDCLSHPDTALYLAARFTAKEAVVKALAGMGVGNGINYKTIEIVGTDLRRFSVNLRMRRSEGLRVFIALTACRRSAIAFAVVTSVR